MPSHAPKNQNRAPQNDPLRPELEPPGGVYLCQVGDQISCGACCGLYNVADSSPGGLTAVLVRRTERFGHTPRHPDAIVAFKDSVVAEESPRRPIEGFHHCPFIGLVGAGGRRVGCLLHPLAAGNRGVDFRGLSHWGALVCRIYFCPSHTDLPARFKKIVRAAAGDWYLYGAVITESRLVKALLESVEKRLGRPLDPRDITDDEAVINAVTRLLRLKLDWPYRDPSFPSPVHYFFKDPLCQKPEIDTSTFGGRQLKHPAILHELASRLRSPAELSAAEALVDDRIETLVGNLISRTTSHGRKG